MVIINSKFLIQNLTGVQRVAFNVSKLLVDKYKDRFLLFAPKGAFNPKYAELLAKDPSFITGKTSSVVWEQIELPIFAKRKNAVILNLGNSGPIFYKRNVVVIHDLLWLRFPKSYSSTFRAWYASMIPRLLKNALKIITVSKASKQDILENFKIPGEKIEVIYPGVDLKTFKPLDLKRENFILWVGSTRFHKNLHGLLKAFMILKEGYKIEHKLTLVGICAENVKDIISESLTKGIIFIKEADDLTLSNLYNRASFFVFPSLYEGFGLPPLEAMACGCPVVVSNAGSLPEVCGEGAVYCDPYDPEDIAHAMYKVLTSEDLRKELIKKGLERSKMFSWERTAEQVLKVIEEIA
jgi:glycosyltransferase involved in cell wall biosynthesis